ncbi:MAG TPA: hypothetical protein VN285_01645 [Candidatus Deferrimicrobium sp.]|nr:hypothetical protein [Candidatus Deferrimicrobium sp.]
MGHKTFFAALCLMIGLLAWPVFGETTPSNGVGDQYLMAVADYFDVSYEDVFAYAATLAPDEIPVVLYIAQRANTSVTSVIELRKKELSWAETASRLGLNAVYFHVIVTGEITSATFIPIFEKFKSTPEQDWRKLQLADDEIVNLVNLRVMYSYYDYSAYEVMSMRDANQSWGTVNKFVAEAKDEYLKAQMAKKD